MPNQPLAVVPLLVGWFFGTSSQLCHTEAQEGALGRKSYYILFCHRSRDGDPREGERLFHNWP